MDLFCGDISDLIITNNKSIVNDDTKTTKQVSSQKENSGTHHAETRVEREPANDIDVKRAKSGTENLDSNKIGSRKRKPVPSNWKHNVRKRKRNSGEEYVDQNGKTVSARQMRPGCKENCRLKCTTKFDESYRKSLHEQFWKMGNLQNQRQFLINNISEKKRSHHSHHLRSNNFGYFLKLDGEKVEVCKTYFINTFGISGTFVYTAWKKADLSGIVSGELRGKHSNHKLPDSLLDGVRSHIKSFPLMKARAKSRRRFIEGCSSVAEMYRLYVEKCEQDSKPSVKLHTYYNIFNFEFNISFIKPVKDSPASIKRQRQRKNRSIQNATHTAVFKMCEYDLQSILQIHPSTGNTT